MMLLSTFECIFELLTSFPLTTGATVDLNIILAVNARNQRSRDLHFDFNQHT